MSFITNTYTTLFLLLFSTASAFSNPRHTPEDTTQLACKNKACRLLDEAFAILKKNYYKKDDIQWNDLLERARERLDNATGCQEANDIVNWCFRELKETHSFLMPPAKAAVYNYDTAQLVSRPALQQLVGEIRGELIENDIGYIMVPWVSTADESISTLVADSLQQIIHRLDRQGVSKWIIDLRNNHGGNYWPMLAGMGPLLGNGVCGYFVKGFDRVAISYKDGIAYQGRYPRCRTSGEKITLSQPDKWVVVLTSPKTSSSGELLTLAFRGLKQTTILGQPTAGFVTANTTYSLSDQSMLVVSICWEADRYGNLQEGRIYPNELVHPDPQYQLEDVVKKKAIMHLQTVGATEIPALKVN